MNKQSGVLLTGANGFVGRYVYKHMKDEGYNLWPVVRSGAQSPYWQEQENVIVGDLLSLTSLPDEIETVIHTAASPLTPTRFETDNLGATRLLTTLAKAANVRKFVFFSAMSVYGDITQPVADENTPINGPSPYGMSKLAGENCVLGGKGSYEPFVLRMPGIIGPGAHRNWLSRMKGSVSQGERIRIYNPTAPFNNAVHLSDLIRLCERVVGTDLEGGVFTLAADGEMTIREVLEVVMEEIGTRSEIDEQMVTKDSWIISSEKAKDRLGYRPMNIGEMIRRFCGEE